MQLLKETLERIRAGETSFEPASASEKDVEDFQKVANRLLEAKNKGLLHDVKVMKDSSSGKLYFQLAFVRGGLTFQGEKFLEEQPSITSQKIENGVTLDIFISHSTADSDVAKSFIALLRAALPIDPTRIRCTSVEGFRLPAGSSFNDQLRSEVFESIVLIALLSPASLNSVYTLFELGARWGAQKYLAPILIRGTEAGALGQPLASLNAIASSSEPDVSQLLVKVAELLKIQAFPYHSYASSLRSFCDSGMKHEW
ncbi:toll/interleukin-1 receptor domain-containing protein [Dechloromonas denitrificans]|uniref:toll/interleukin-1 receptor domain-containing protein n=1 Tax=Dechloromonas denitrificans TaxID=281362 RepID=UPI001CF88E99|nr:toll/interleukin-1 receptor domain-containing protein [Dechloromonas denitrificans]UCV03058.1 toll/interleukin-1 receptor domain-containing protein [Dechloromonas denitrificans]